MSLKTDIARDWRVFDEVFEGSVVAKSASLPDMTCAKTKMLRQVITTNVAKMFGSAFIDPGDIAVTVWDYREEETPALPNVQDVLGREIEAGDLLVFPGNRQWWITQAVYDDVTSSWVCRCNRELRT